MAFLFFRPDKAIIFRGFKVTTYSPLIEVALDAVVEELRHARSALFITGAGISADSGLPTYRGCLLYTSPSPRDRTRSRMPSSA